MAKLCLATLALGIASSASEAEAGPMRNINSSLCADVSGASLADGANLIQWSCSGGSAPNQDVQAVSLGNGFYQLKAAHSGKCLDWGSNSPALNTAVKQRSCQSADRFAFRAIQATDGSYRFRSKNGVCLGIRDRSLQNGAQAVAADCTAGRSVRWNFQLGAPPSGSAFARIYREDFSSPLDETAWNLDSGFTYEESYVTRDNANVSNGALNLNFTNNGSGYRTAWASLNRGNAPKIRYGKVSARLRADATYGVSVAALLWPTSNYQGEEFDFFETWDVSGSKYPMKAVTHFPNYAGQEAYDAWADGTQWHVWTIEWTPQYVSYQVDGAEFARVTESWKISSKEMYVGFMTAVHTGHRPTASRSTFQIDWVEVYRYQP